MISGEFDGRRMAATAQIVDQAMESYAASSGTWRRFLTTLLRDSCKFDLAPLRLALVQRGELLSRQGQTKLAALAFGSALGFPTPMDGFERTPVVAAFCSAWLDTHATPARLDVAILVMEGCAANSEEVTKRRHLVIELLRECLVLEPNAAAIIIATATRSGIDESELRR